MIVLLAIAKKDCYGYELIVEVSKVVDVNDGTIYPILKRLTNDSHAETYLVESNEGPPRKYYRLTPNGRKHIEELTSSWLSFQESVNKVIEEGK